MTDISEYCDYCNNYFLKDYIKYTDIYTGTFTISNHQFVSPSFSLKAGQYFRIKGSDLNDGVYCNTEASLALLADEEFNGQVWLMSVPRAFIALCNDVAAWRTKNESLNSANMSVFQSETVQGVYSYTKGNGNGGSGSASWQSIKVFTDRFIPYRRTSEL